MARQTDVRPIVRLRSTAGTGYTYVTRKNRRNDPDRLVLRSTTPSCAGTSSKRRNNPGPPGTADPAARAGARASVAGGCGKGPHLALDRDRMTTVETLPAPLVTSPRPVSVGRRTALVALAVGAVFNQAASVLATMFNSGDTSAAGYTDAIDERGLLGVLGALANVAGIPLMLLGLIGLLQYSGRRAPVAARIGIIASTVGFIGFFAMSASLAALYDLARPLEPAQLAPVLAALTGRAAGWPSRSSWSASCLAPRWG